MKTIDVVAAIIMKDERILATERGYGEFEGGWEFPGGKVEAGETGEQAIRREIMEELRVSIEVERCLTRVEHDYGTFHLSMRCYICTLTNPEDHLVLTEHHAARWVDANTIDSVAWLPADLKVVAAIKEAGLAR